MRTKVFYLYCSSDPEHQESKAGHLVIYLLQRILEIFSPLNQQYVQIFSFFVILTMQYQVKLFGYKFIFVLWIKSKKIFNLCNDQKMYPGPRSSKRFYSRGYFFNRDFLGFFLFTDVILHCFICRPSDSAVPEDAGIGLRTVATVALPARRSNHPARSLPHLAISHPLDGIQPSDLAEMR